MGSAAPLLGALACVLLVVGCSVGNGTGRAEGRVTAPACDQRDAPWALDPSYFGAEHTEGHLEIRMQRGSDLEIRSDGIVIYVPNAAAVREGMLGAPISVDASDAAPVRMHLYLNETCPIHRGVVPVSYEAASGSITFQSIYAPAVDEDEVEITARFEDVHFVDPSAAESRHATLSGELDFLYVRGRPAQRFP